jgi:hypothetical protein
LLTDFGAQDPYVASMKGTILRINPRCNLIDITHQISPHDIKEGAFILANACLSFPKGTIHLAVVDPGVGSLRKPILLVTKNYFFLGPDNWKWRILRDIGQGRQRREGVESQGRGQGRSSSSGEKVK